MAYKLNDFRVGDRVELHPGTDLWMRGARYGTVMRIGRDKLTVNVDQLRRDVRVAPRNIGGILSE